MIFTKIPEIPEVPDTRNSGQNSGTSFSGTGTGPEFRKILNSGAGNPVNRISGTTLIKTSMQ